MSEHLSAHQIKGSKINFICHRNNWRLCKEIRLLFRPNSQAFSCQKFAKNNIVLRGGFLETKIFNIGGFP
jgi:hypothetical protein